MLLTNSNTFGQCISTERPIPFSVRDIFILEKGVTQCIRAHSRSRKPHSPSMNLREGFRMFFKLETSTILNCK